MESDMKPEITWQDFEKLDIRSGTVLSAEDFPKAKNPAYQLTIDFGGLGIKKSSARITKLHRKEDLVGMQILAVVNFPVKQIANFFSECLVLGLYGKDETEITLITTTLPVENGRRLG
ncbi:tRNA-binding protein [Chryseobacterium sp. Leaf180]|uniref:tRNA-binding protein n=1 Tax=Chryseobacterium sp. Leaf180 TaxID=1736289 RepID=UPI0006FB44C9|nr:tRNA-binding protein [Chryseobacterium sp. Leaf180]KQR95321.1 tRNA-binding protein [Chryseobacterium sp. Leaf180]